MYFNNYIILHDLLPDKGELIGTVITNSKILISLIGKILYFVKPAWLSTNNNINTETLVCIFK